MNPSIAKPIPMTEEQKFFFDLRGWILLPGVLTQEENWYDEAEAYGVDLVRQRQATNPNQSFQGTLQTLLDHPAIAGILSEILAEEPFWAERLLRIPLRKFVYNDSTAWVEQDGAQGRWDAACGASTAAGQRDALSGGRREDIRRSDTEWWVWELEEVKAGQGGTSFSAGRTSPISAMEGRTVTDPTQATPPGNTASGR